VILVVAETRGDALSRVSLEAVAAAQQLAGAAPVGADPVGAEPVGAIVLAGPGAGGAAASELAAADLAQVWLAEHPSLAAYTADAMTMALANAITQIGPAIVVLPHTYRTRDFAPMLATRLRRPVITDVVAVTGTGRAASFARPMFQGKLVADVRPTDDGLLFVTTQVGAFRADAVRSRVQDARGGSPPVSNLAVQIDASRIRQVPEAPFQEAAQAVDLGQAERIVAVGRGIKAAEHVAIAAGLATAMRAELAASRPICDNGWLPMDRQVGSSGQTVSPKLYVALGISGAIQHLVGMKGSRTIVAINKDPEAPIFEIADYGLVGDLFELVPALTAELAKAPR
jgi:electron transfer flavoprotein alpha subunit